jgi:hypothetical protein
VFSIEKEGILFPARVVEVVSIGTNGGYTQVVMLDLKALDANSPIARPITSDSFRNMGSGYQVYTFGELGKEQIAERYDRSPALSPGSGSNLRTLFLWVNGFVILVMLAAIIYRYRKKKSL